VTDDAPSPYSAPAVLAISGVSHHCKTQTECRIGTSPVTRRCSITLSIPCRELQFAFHVFPSRIQQCSGDWPYVAFSPTALKVKPPRLAWIALPGPHG